jgi:uncharacterized membrane protein YczE
VLPIPTATELRHRTPRLLAGLVLCGVGIGLMVRADLGLAPWDVLHQGISQRTGLPQGQVTVLVSFAVLTLWVPLRERPGLGTLANAVVIGLVVDLTLAVLETPPTTAGRVGLLLVGAFLFGPGSGLYIGAGLGPGPRDGLMTALARRGGSVRSVRTAIELSALGIGVLLGGTVGVGTIVFALSVGPNVQVFLARWSLPSLARPTPPGIAPAEAG